jgi:hypothetical protein
LHHKLFNMAASSVWTLLKPVLLISKWTGTFPINLDLNQEGQLRVTVNKHVFLASLVYHFINLSRDFHYVLIHGFIEAGGSVKPIQILTLLNDTLYNFFMIAIFLLTLTKVRTFSYILSKFEAIQNELKIDFQNLKMFKKIIAFAIVFQMKDSAEIFYRLCRHIVRGDDVSALNYFHYFFSLLAITNHSMIELEFGIIVFIVLAYLRAMNTLVAGSMNCVKNTNWDGLRRIFAHLHDICVNLNSSYALCILCSLILRAIHVQIEVFRNATLLYDLILVAKQSSFDAEFLDAMRWLIMELFRLTMIIIVCAKVTSEVS